MCRFICRRFFYVPLDLHKIILCICMYKGQGKSVPDEVKFLVEGDLIDERPTLCSGAARMVLSI